MRDRDVELEFVIEPLGETTLLLRFGNTIDATTNSRVHVAASTLQAARLPGMIDIVPAYSSLALVYSPVVWADGSGLPWRQFSAAVQAAFAAPPALVRRTEKRVDIPVCYDLACGIDLEEVARHCSLSVDALIARHVAGDYCVAMLGFAPGFPYLIGLDSTLRTPRRANPRQRVPPGSVAIGGLQTGIYPGQLPGGWQLIGRTPLQLFDPKREPPCLLAPGDRVRFHAIDVDEFAGLERLTLS